MIEFEKPNIECLEVDDTKNYAKFVCEPLERGYGVTIGNSLRRILLSSLPGCAITSVKIDGVLHEFSCIPNVVEDVPEIIVNLKNVRLKFDGNEEKTLRIEHKGEGEVTAGDIITDGTVEILNPDLHIATVSEGGNLVMEMTADRGRGYNSSEKNKKPNQDISVLPIDSIYTPVKKVNYQVENTRVGQMVDYDKLTPEDMVVVDLQGNKVEGDLNPSSDTATHVELYNRFPNIGGVVHTHSPWATSWAQAGRGIPCYGTTHADYLYGTVPCVRNLTKEEIDEAYEKNTGVLIADRFDEDDLDYVATPAVLCKNHGPFTWGKDAHEAVHNAVVLEEVAKMAARCEMINPDVKPAPQELQDKHYFRKHGANAYYGQPGK